MKTITYEYIVSFISFGHRQLNSTQAALEKEFGVVTYNDWLISALQSFCLFDMELCFQLPKLFQNINRRWLLVVGVVAVTHTLFQFLLLPYGNALRSLFPNVNDSMYDKSSFAVIQSSKKSVMVRYPLTVDKSSLTNYFKFDGVLENADDSKGGGEEGHDDGTKKNSEDIDHDFSSEEGDMEVLDNVIQLEVDRDLEDDFPSEDVKDRHGTFASGGVKTEESNPVLKLANEARLSLPLERNVKSDHDIPTDNVLQQNKSQAHKEFEHVNSTLPVDSQAVASSTKATYLKSNGSSSIGPAALKSDSAAAKNYSVVLAKPGKKKDEV